MRLPLPCMQIAFKKINLTSKLERRLSSYHFQMKEDRGSLAKSSRTIRQESDRQFLWLVILTLVVGGSAVIALVYGTTALLTSLPFLLGGAALILFLYLVLNGLERLLKRFNGEP
jgi:hypothetical protein